MPHALIIDDNMAIGRAIESRLVSLGFDSFDRTWTEAQAMAAAACCPPDLVVIGDTIACGCPSHAAELLAKQSDAPILLVTAGHCEVQRRIPEGAVVDGPFALGDIGSAVALARRSTSTTSPIPRPAERHESEMPALAAAPA